PELVSVAYAPGPCGRFAGLRGAAPDDEDGAPHDLPAGLGGRGGPDAPERYPAARPRGTSRPAGPPGTPAGKGIVARAGGQRLWHQAHDPRTGLPRLGAAQEAQARVRAPDRR